MISPRVPARGERPGRPGVVPAEPPQPPVPAGAPIALGFSLEQLELLRTMVLDAAPYYRSPDAVAVRSYIALACAKARREGP